jgi:hypothetical protein
MNYKRLHVLIAVMVNHKSTKHIETALPLFCFKNYSFPNKRAILHKMSQMTSRNSITILKYKINLNSFSDDGFLPCTPEQIKKVTSIVTLRMGLKPVCSDCEFRQATQKLCEFVQVT